MSTVPYEKDTEHQKGLSVEYFYSISQSFLNLQLWSRKFVREVIIRK